MACSHFYIFLNFIALIALSQAVCLESSTTVHGHAAPIGRICSGDLIFDEEFDNFNLKTWSHEITLSGGGNGEFEYFVNNRTNSFTEDGALHLRPTLLTDDYPEEFLYSGTLDIGDSCTNFLNDGCKRTGNATHIINPIKSARIGTINSFSFKYGTISVRARMPVGDWLWSAIWALPTFSAYGNWPASGDFDLVECRGNKNLTNSDGVNAGTQQAFTTLRWGPYPALDQFNRTHWLTNNESHDFASDFHIYETVWTSDGFTFSIDGELVGNVTVPDGGFWELGQFEGTGLNNPWQGGTKMAPFDQEYHLLISLAIGGVTFFNDSWTNEGGKPWENDSPTATTDFWKGKDQWAKTWDFVNGGSDLVVDYVKVYAI